MIILLSNIAYFGIMLLFICLFIRTILFEYGIDTIIISSSPALGLATSYDEVKHIDRSRDGMG